MKIEIKRLVGTKWHPIPINDLLGKSICNYMVDSQDTIVAALYEGKKHVGIVSNREDILAQYKDKVFTITAQNLQKLIGTDTLHPLLAETFPEAGVARITVIKEEQNGMVQEL